MPKVPRKSKAARGEFVVLNDRGLHTRPSTEIVKCASRFKSYVTLRYQKQEANAKSLLGVLMLAAEKGAKVTVCAEGEDARAAVASILDLAMRNFDLKF